MATLIAIDTDLSVSDKYKEPLEETIALLFGGCLTN